MRSLATGALLVVLVPMMVLASAPLTQANQNPIHPHLAGVLPEVETQILRAVQAANLADQLIEIAAGTDGHVTVAGLWFTDSGTPTDSPSAVLGYAEDLAQAVFVSAPALDEVDLTGVHPDGTSPDPPHLKVVFSAAISRHELPRLPGGVAAPDKLIPLTRVWYRDREAGPPASVAPGLSGRGRDPRPLQQHLAHPPLQDQSVGIEIYHGDPGRRTVAITFDDGPFPIYTTLLLDTLERLGIKATFFLVGQQVEEYPYFAEAIARAGDEVANHTFHHLNLTRLPAQEVLQEIAGAQETITAITGRAPRYFRPPGGDYNDTVLETAHRLELTTVFWTANSADYTNPEPAALEARVTARVSGGGIMLFHQGIVNTLRILPHLTEILRGRGYLITAVGDLLAEDARPERRPAESHVTH